MSAELHPALPCPTLPQLPPRKADSHKGNYGSALLIGGSRGMAGSIAMAGMAAIRSGAGLVRLAIPDRCLETVAGFSPCAMTIALVEDAQGRIVSRALDSLEPHLSSATCVALGPGLGQSRELQIFVRGLVRRVACPLIIDADGLNNLADACDCLSNMGAPLIVTPHPGEWARLSGVAASDRAAQCRAAVDFAQRTGAVVVLKGHHTLITDGRSAVWNATGTPAMATGGSGDVLTGLIAALVCQGMGARDSAHLGVHLHGLAAEIAERELAMPVVLPTELIDAMPRAFQVLARDSAPPTPVCQQ